LGDPYVDPRTGVLKNKLGIGDEDELRRAEADISAAALFELEMSPHLGEGHFDLGHLRALHVRIFGEVYPWAGKPRTVDIAKGTWFCLARNIEEFAASVFGELASQNYLVGLERRELVKGVGELYGQLNALHPFREGNGRTQRAFLTALGRLGGWRIRWSDMDRAANTAASRRSLEQGDDSALVEMIEALLDLVPPPSELVGMQRRVVLASPAVAELMPGGVEQFRAGPYPGEETCAVCHERFLLSQEPSVLLHRPFPTPEPVGLFSYAHARCGRSRLLRQPTVREVRAWHAALATNGADATGAAILLDSLSPARAGFAWRSDEVLLRRAGDDVVDLPLSIALGLGMRPFMGQSSQTDRTPDWSVIVVSSSATITVRYPNGARAFVGEDMDLPPGWLDAVAMSGECVLYLTSRGELDLPGLNIAARQGRVVFGVASATVVP
jgi:cell filamentation protein